MEKLSQEEGSSRADPIFKALTRFEAEQHGLQAVETEFQYSTRTDIVLKVPEGVSVEGTMFDFFRKTNVVEFKSQGDPLTLRKYLKNELRTTLQVLLDDDDDFENTLNVVVSARYPVKFLKQARKRRIRFKRDRDKRWLLRGQVGFQDVVIVICVDLPVEERYYKWLVFAPSDSPKWREYVQALLKEHNISMLETAKGMHPKEFNMIADEEYRKLLAQMPKRKLSAKERAEIARLDASISATAKEIMRELTDLGAISVEDRLEDLTPEQRLAGLGQEERQKLLKLLLEQTKEEKPE